MATGRLTRREIFVDPGCVVVPNPHAYLCCVIGSGMAVALFDAKGKAGGMCHFLKPQRPSPRQSTPTYAAPALVSLVRMLMGTDKPRRHRIRAYLVGGAERRDAAGYEAGLGMANVEAIRNLLQHFKIPIHRQAVGGRVGRKAIFHSGTGEFAVQEVERIRATDWYPAHSPGGRR